MGKEYLVEGAVLMCVNGGECGMLKIPAGHGYTSGGKKKANCTDCIVCENIPYFGSCRKNEKNHQCEGFIKLADKWESMAVSVTKPEKVDGEDALTMDSILLCKKGGIIMPLTSGQGYGKGMDMEGFLKRYQNAIRWAAGKNLLCQVFGGDPINMNTGNFIYEKEDLVIFGITQLSVHLFYNSLEEDRGGCLGEGWHHNFELYIRKEEGGRRLSVCMGDGRELPYERTLGNLYVSVFGDGGVLKREDNGYRYSTPSGAPNGVTDGVPSGTEYFFGAEGLLLERKDRNGNTDLFTHDGQGRLIKAEGANGGEIRYHYNKEGKLICVQDHTGREVRLWYRYGKLWKFINAAGQTYTYLYNENGKLESVETPRGIIGVKNTYDAVGRVVKQELPDGGVIEMKYDDETMRTYMKQQNGSMVIHESDGRFRNVKNIYEDGEEVFTYNDRNQKTSYVDKKGNRTRYRYDEKGNLVEMQNPMGQKILLEYDKKGHLTVLKLPDGTGERNIYNELGNLVERVDPLGNVMRMKYDSSNRLEEIIQEDGFKIQVAYDIRGNIERISDAMGYKTMYQYDELNRITALIDGNGNTTRYTYNERNDIIEIINPAGNKRKYEYSPSGKVTRVTDYDGFTIGFEYDTSNRIERYIDKGGTNLCYSYDKMGNIVEVKFPNGGTRSYTYNQRNQLCKYADMLGNITEYEYDANGNRTKILNADGAVTLFSYDSLDRINTVIEADGCKSSYEYNIRGQVSKITYPGGKTEEIEYDACGRCVQKKDIFGNVARYTYSPIGKPEEIIDEIGRKTCLSYYPGGFLKKVLYPNGTSLALSYDGNGNMTEIKNQEDYRIIYRYDNLDRIVEITSSIGEQMKYEYDAVGNIIVFTDGNGNVRKYEYSPDGNMTAVIDADGNKSMYEYNCMGELILLENVIGNFEGAFEATTELNRKQRHITSYERNLNGHVKAVTDALGNKESYEYDCNGRVIKKTDREGYETFYEYGVAGTITKVGYADGRYVEYEYNSVRQLVQVKDWQGETNIVPDEYGRAIRVVDPKGSTISYEYENTGETSAVVYPDGERVDYIYDDCMRLIRTHAKAGDTIYHYNKNSYLEEKLLPSGIRTGYEYDKAGRVTKIVNSEHGQILDEFIYTYDSVGNRTTMQKRRSGISHLDGSYSFLYDKESRLTRVDKDQHLVREYGYDGYGNRSYLRTDEKKITYFYNALNQLVETAGDYKITYNYDKRGNLKDVWEDGKKAFCYEYDAAGHLACSNTKSGICKKYIYNGLGHRTGTECLKNTTEGSVFESSKNEYVLDLTRGFHNLLQEKNGNKIRKYIWDGGPLAAEDDKCSRYYLRDELGSPIRFVYYNGNLSEAYDYDEFGNLQYGVWNGEQPFGFTGYQKDTVSGCYFAQAREYRPWEGRFAGEDTVGPALGYPQSINRYNYCYNNPINYVDRDGRIAFLLTMGVGALIGGVIGGVGTVASDLIHGRDVDLKEAGKNALKGAVGGAVIGSGVGAVGAIATAAGASATAVTTATVGGAIGGTLGSAMEMGYQAYNDDIDMGKVTIGGAGGAASGMLMGSTANLGVSMLGNSAISAVQSVGTDLYTGNTKYMKQNAAISAISGLVSGYFGGRGACYGNYVVRNIKNIRFHIVQKSVITVHKSVIQKAMIQGTVKSFLSLIGSRYLSEKIDDFRDGASESTSNSCEAID